MIIKDRIASIDIFRGLCMLWMILGHTLEWWLIPETYYCLTPIVTLVDAIGASGFLFVSAISITISLHKKLGKIINNNSSEYKKIRSEYFIRAILLLLLGLIYNLSVGLWHNDLTKVWSWFILLTIPISLLLLWPLISLKPYSKIIIIIGFLLLNQTLISFLAPFKREYNNMFGLIYYFLFNGFHLSPILAYFPIFIIGNILGDIIFKNLISENKEVFRKDYVKKIYIPILLISILLIICGTLSNTPSILEKNSLSWILYAIGIQLIIFNSLFIIEYLKILKFKGKYRFLYYYSAFSLTIFLSQYLLFFAFNKQLDLIFYIFAFSLTTIITRFLLKIIYVRFGLKLSLKYQITKLASYLTELIK